MKSIARQRIGEEKYRTLNETFPGIEGSFFTFLDSIEIFNGLEPAARISYSSIRGLGINFTLLNHFSDNTFGGAKYNSYIYVTFDSLNKRIRISFQSFKSSTKASMLSKIHKELNIFQSDRVTNCEYSFKYNQKNCKNVIDILNLILFDFNSKKRKREN